MVYIKGKCLKIVPEEHNLFKLSVSKAKTFKSCKRKYLFNYIEKLEKKEWDFQIFGKFLHQVLENFHGEIITGYVGPDNVLMKRSFNKALIEYKDKLTKDQRLECFEILKLYLVKLYEDRKTNVLPTMICVEKDFNIEVDGKILINGFIDVVQRDVDGVLHVADYKTSKSKKYLKNDFMQLKTYAYAMCLEDPDLQRIRCSYVMLRHNFDSIVTEFDRDEVLEMEKEFEEYAKIIQEEKLFRATPSPLCKYCDYLGNCPEGKDKMGISDGNFGEVSW
jgi:RecB family exonuclease